MKKLYTTLVAILAIFHFSYAQWDTKVTASLPFRNRNMASPYSNDNQLDYKSSGDSTVNKVNISKRFPAQRYPDLRQPYNFIDYLPLTAGSGNKLTGSLYFDGPTGNFILFQTAGSNVGLLTNSSTIITGGSTTDMTAYVYGNNPFNIYTNNVKRFTVDGSGDAYLASGSLFINGPTGNSILFQKAGTNTGLLTHSSIVATGGSTTDMTAYVYGNNPFNVYTNNIKRFAVEGNGDVILSGGNQYINNASLNLASSTLNIDGPSGNAIFFKKAGTNLAVFTNSSGIVTGGSSTDMAAYVYGNNPFNIYTNNLHRFTVDGNGNVGIGTTAPNARLQVSGTVSVIDAPSTLNSSMPIVTGSTLGPSYSSWGISINHIVENAGYNSYGMGLFTMESYLTGRTEKLRITSSGKVGIGTTSPDEKLTVKGKIHAEEVKIDLSVPAPDYVFEDDYKLPALNDLKAYVDKNHHLPEIPSAKEMARDGLNLGEMNTLLLKKVEELTLYLIEQDKQLKQQTERINKLEKQLPKTNKRK